MDKVRCFCCNGIVSGWKEGEEPWKIHSYLYPNCLYCVYELDGDFIRNVHMEKRMEKYPLMLEASKREGDLLLNLPHERSHEKSPIEKGSEKNGHEKGEAHR